MSDESGKTAWNLPGIAAVMTALVAVCGFLYDHSFFRPSSTTPAFSSGEVAEITASSTRRPMTYQGELRTYLPANALDGKVSTAWVEGVPGPGINEWLRVSFRRPIAISGVSILAGYGADRVRFRSNNRVKRFVLTFSDDTRQEFALKDSEDPQRVDFRSRKIVRWVSFTILEVYGGDRDLEDTAISEVAFD